MCCSMPIYSFRPPTGESGSGSLFLGLFTRGAYLAFHAHFTELAPSIELEGMLQNTSHFPRDSRRTCDCHDRMAIDLQDFIGAIVHHDIACRNPSISRHKNTPGILKLKMVVAGVATKSERLPGLEGISLISRRCFRTVRKSPASGFA